MNTEQRLRDALQAETARVEPADGWAAIEAAIARPPARNRNRMVALAAAASVAVVAAAVALATNEPDSRPVVTEPAPSTSTSRASTTSTVGPTTTVRVAPTTVPATTVPVAQAPQYVWPFDNATTYDSPVKLADAFARDFLGMPNPRLGGYRSGDSRSGEIDVHPHATGTIGTTLSVRQDAVGWHVVDARTDNIELDAPTRAASIASPVRLTGRSVTYEATMRVAVLRLGTTMRCTVPTDSCGADHGVLANTYFTGGGGTEKLPFSAEVEFKRSSTAYGLVVLFTDSQEDGTLAQATVRLVRFR